MAWFEDRCKCYVDRKPKTLPKHLLSAGDVRRINQERFERWCEEEGIDHGTAKRQSKRAASLDMDATQTEDWSKP
jgi:hypothetical protein